MYAHINTHMQEMLVTRVRKETKETQEYKERLVYRDHLAHKVWEVVGLCYHNQ